MEKKKKNNFILACDVLTKPLFQVACDGWQPTQCESENSKAKTYRGQSYFNACKLKI